MIVAFLSTVYDLIAKSILCCRILIEFHPFVSKTRRVSSELAMYRMTLLLGPPGSGKTTLLLALAAKLDPELKMEGTVTYNGHTMNEFVPQRTSSYISQQDLHVPEMTVRETLDFSARCQGVGTRYGKTQLTP